MHLPNFVDVVVQRGHLRLFFSQNGAGLVERPGKVIAIIVHGNVGILRRIESTSLAIAEPLIHPANDVARHLRKKLFTR